MSTVLKVFNAIFAIVLTFLLWYALYVYFFVTPLIWVGNIIMFYMNFIFFIHWMALFLNKKERIRIKKEKFFYWGIDTVEMLIIAFLFAAFGWWYYATISILIFIFIIQIFKEN